MKSAISTSIFEGISASGHVSSDWIKPTEWPDLRDAPDGSIQLFVYEAQAGFAFSVTCVNGFTVYVDGVKHGDFLSAAQCSIDWSGYKSGYSLSYPLTSKGHIIKVVPTIPESNITKYRTLKYDMLAGSQNQGVLWAHFQLRKSINLLQAFKHAVELYNNDFLEAVTSKDNLLKTTEVQAYGLSSGSLKTLPVLDFSDVSGGYSLSSGLPNILVKKIKIKNVGNIVRNLATFFGFCVNLEKIIFENVDTSSVTGFQSIHIDNRSLKRLPPYNFSSAENMGGFLTNAKNLEPTFLDLSQAVNLTILGCYGTPSMPVMGLKGLIVSPFSPFTGAAPQINISYTGLEKGALVALFNSMPYVSKGQIINISGASGAGELSAQEIEIATSKGWTVLK
ncbi:hypothetical protein Dip510_001864 [Elusimicrobium posterum]|uniref:hypothetical protein n=1 Tax=Elusimicrobium posterum TaxID=3116653 RepID=UPI003C70BCD9